MTATEQVEVTAVGVLAANGVPFIVRVVKHGERFGRDLCLTYDEETPSVEFYDARFPFDAHVGAQFTGGRYYVSTILGEDGYGSAEGGLDLVGYEPSWKVDATTMEFVRQWLREVR